MAPRTLWSRVARNKVLTKVGGAARKAGSAVGSWR